MKQKKYAPQSHKDDAKTHTQLDTANNSTIIEQHKPIADNTSDPRYGRGDYVGHALGLEVRYV